MSKFGKWDNIIGLNGYSEATLGVSTKYDMKFGFIEADVKQTIKPFARLVCRVHALQISYPQGQSRYLRLYSYVCVTLLDCWEIVCTTSLEYFRSPMYI